MEPTTIPQQFFEMFTQGEQELHTFTYREEGGENQDVSVRLAKNCSDIYLLLVVPTSTKSGNAAYVYVYWAHGGHAPTQEFFKNPIDSRMFLSMALITFGLSGTASYNTRGIFSEHPAGMILNGKMLIALTELCKKS